MSTQSEVPVLSAPPQEVTDERTPLRLVVFGEPGVGKTSLALSFPRPIIINTDEGLEGDALEQLRGRKGYEHSPTGHKDLEALYLWIKEKAEHFDTIVIDSLDEIVRLLLDEIVAEGKGMRAAKTMGQSITDLVPEQAEYQASQRQLHTFLSKLRGLGKMIVLTSAIREPKPVSAGGAVGAKRTVDVSPGLQKIVNRWASVMGELVTIGVNADGELDDAADPKRVLSVDPASRRSTNKTRYKALLPFVVIPEGGGYDQIVSRIEAGRAAASQPADADDN
jgi:hypothetical protein